MILREIWKPERGRRAGGEGRGECFVVEGKTGRWTGASLSSLDEDKECSLDEDKER